MGATIEQIIAVLNSDTGNLAYNLVLSFSLAGALFFAVAAVQRNNSPAVRRTIVGLSLLLVLRLALFVASGLVWQGVLDGVIWLPLLGRAITLLSLVLIIWLWAFDEPSPAGDTAAFLLGLLVLTGAILGGVWWSGQTFSGNFNHTTTDRLVQMAAIAILALGILALLLRRPEGWVLGLVMESLLLAGHVIYLVTPADIYDYPTVIRLFQMAAYPFLLFLAQRLYPSGSAEVIPQESGTQHQVEPRQAVDSKTYNAERVLSALQKLTTESEPSRACHRACASVVELMDDEICVLVDPPDGEGRMFMRCAFDRSQGSYLEEGQLSVGEAPMLASSLKLGRSRRLVAGSDVADFKALEHLLNRSHTGDILYSPVLSAAGSPKLMIVVLSPEKARDWSPAEQALLKIFGRFLVQFLQQNRDMADMISDLELSFQARRNAQDQAQRTLELNQKLRDQLVVLQDDIDQKAGQIASMAAILAATAGVQESLSSVQEDKVGIQAEAGELPRLASHDQITEQMLDQLRAENEALSADLQQLSEQVAKRDPVEEGELRLALEEIAILQQTLNESENHIATLKTSLSEAPASNQQIASVIEIAGDLRQPLSSIVGYADFLLSEVVGILGDKQRKYLERIRLSTERMSQLLDELLQTISPEGNLARLDIEEIDLSAVLQRAIVQSGERYDDRQVALQIDIPDNDLRINADQRALQKVFLRLLDNASTITPPGGEVNLLARMENGDASQDYVLVQVSDGGGGIDVNDLPNVFSHRSSGISTAGLGVNGTDWSEIKSLVEVHGGRIWVDSDEGQGATFSVLLPVTGADTMSALEVP